MPMLVSREDLGTEGPLMDYNEICPIFENDVRWLHGKYMGIRHAFESGVPKHMMADIELASAQRMLAELTEKVNGIIAARDAVIAKAREVV